MLKPDPVLFTVLLENGRNDLDPNFILDSATRTKTCVCDLLAVVGYEGRLGARVDKVDNVWQLIVRVEQKFLVQLDLFSSRGEIPTVAQIGKEVIEAALIAVARFRRETGGIAAASLSEVLKQLKSADPRVIAAIARQPARKLTIRQDGTDLELSVQSDSTRSVSSQIETLSGVILAVGTADLFVLPQNRRSTRHLCLHPVRVKIPVGLIDQVNPVVVLQRFVEPRRRVNLQVQAEVVVRSRRQLTCLLVKWPAS